jgi:cell division protease FtsH
MIAQLVVALLIVSNVAAFTPVVNRVSRVSPIRMAVNDKENNLFASFRGVVASAIAFGSIGGSANAAEYQAAAAPPQMAPQVAREAPRAAQPGTPEKWIYSKFLDQVEKDQVEKVTFSPDGKRAVGVDNDGDRFTCDIPNDPNLLSFLVQHKVEINVAPINANGGTGTDAAAALVLPDSETERLLQTFVVPGVLTSLIFLYPTFKLLFPSKEEREKAKQKPTGGRGGGGGGRGPGGLFGGGGGGRGGGGRGPGGLDPEAFAKSKAKIDLTPVTNTNFADVAGCDSAKLELEEVVDFLKNPDKYTEMGAKIPSGCLLNGPPGTGKTLLARAVAGEAGVPFISVSGSEFVQVFVGVGAARVRDMFKSARENAPCIIFIDEIDAIGRQRGSGQSNDEREQTLNQLLVEMDGFDGNPGVITIAATNRIDILDEALVRAGRFDRKIEVSLPDNRGRFDVLKVHARNKPLSPDVDLEQVARRTPGLSGASLKNLLNEAAIHAARSEKEIIEWDDVDWAIDRVTVGMEKPNKDALVQDIELVAFHEAGHAIVGGLLPEYDTVTKISITPRVSGAGGLTFFSPLEDRLDNVVTWHYLESQIAVAWGGRVAEELVFGASKVTTGASGDLQQIFRVARAMVCQLGMSRLPPLTYDFEGQGDGDVDWQLSAWLKERINSEILRIASNGYYTAKKILMENEDLLWALARRLVQDDQVSQEEFHFMLYEYNAKTYPYSMYGDTKVDEMPYQNDPDSVADDLFDAMPKFSELMPKASELTDPTAIANLPALKLKYEQDEAAALEKMRRPNPLLNEDWGKSKMEIVAEAMRVKTEEERKVKLMKVLEQYSEEDAIKKQLKIAKTAREAAVKKLLDAGVM